MFNGSYFSPYKPYTAQFHNRRAGVLYVLYDVCLNQLFYTFIIVPIYTRSHDYDMYYYYYYCNDFTRAALHLFVYYIIIKIRSPEWQTVSVTRNLLLLYYYYHVPQMKLPRLWWAGSSGHMIMYNNDDCTALFLRLGLARAFGIVLLKYYYIDVSLY